jgi:hypothetical protein
LQEKLQSIVSGHHIARKIAKILSFVENVIPFRYSLSLMQNLSVFTRSAALTLSVGAMPIISVAF